MSIDPAASWPALAALVEVPVFFLAGLAAFRRWGHSLAEAASYALITVMLTLSFLFQLFFLLKKPWISMVLEAIIFLGGCLFIIRNSRFLVDWGRSVKKMALKQPVLAVILALPMTFLAASALFLPPDSLHWDHLTRVLLFERNNAFWSGGPESWTGGLFPVNQTILAHHFLRFNCDLFSGLFNFLAYLSIGFSTYALARRFSWPRTAFMVTLVVISMPRLVFLSGSCGTELIRVGVVLFCLLAAFRAVESPNIRDMLFLIWGLFFSISGQALIFLFPGIMTLLCLVLLFRRHGLVTWRALLWNNKITVLAALPPAVIFSQVWLFLGNMSVCGEMIPTPDPAVFQWNPDALTGGLANCGRYLFQTADFTWPVDRLCLWAFHFSPREILAGIYGITVQALFGPKGAAVPFSLDWVSNESLSWFGPLAFLLVLPALVYALLRGNRRLKAIALALFGYFYLVCVLAAWLPENACCFTVFFVCGGLVTGFFLPPWRFTRRDMRRLAAICVLLLLFGVLGNSRRLLIDPERMAAWGAAGRQSGREMIRADWGGDVYGQAAVFFHDQRLVRFAALVGPGSKVGVCSRGLRPLYPYLLANREVTFLLFPESGPKVPPRNPSYDYLLYLGLPPETGVGKEAVTSIWKSSNESALPGELFKFINGGPHATRADMIFVFLNGKQEFSHWAGGPATRAS